MLKSHSAMCLIVAGLTLGCGRSEEQKFRVGMLRVLEADRDLSAKRKMVNPATSTPTQVANAIGQYCAAADRLDMSDCPAEFRVAFRHHLEAWGKVEVAVRRLPEDFLEGTLVGLVNGLTGELDGGYSRMVGALKSAEAEVNATFQEVEKIAAKHGAAL